MKLKVCPNCGLINDDDWPIDSPKGMQEGGCQGCWEEQSDAMWWEMVEATYDMGLQHD